VLEKVPFIAVVVVVVGGTCCIVVVVGMAIAICIPMILDPG